MNAGFLPTRGTLALDLVFVLMFAIVLVMGVSIYLVRRGHFQLHKRIQITSSIVLLLAIVTFEVDMRFYTDWRSLAAASPFFDSGWVTRWLIVHLVFAIPTPFLWAGVLIAALRRFPRPPGPAKHSRIHRRAGWLAAFMMFMTAATGWVFYYVAFVAG